MILNIQYQNIKILIINKNKILVLLNKVIVCKTESKINNLFH